LFENFSDCNRLVTLDYEQLITMLYLDSHGHGVASQAYDRIAGGRHTAEIA